MVDFWEITAWKKFEHLHFERFFFFKENGPIFPNLNLILSLLKMGPLLLYSSVSFCMKSLIHSIRKTFSLIYQEYAFLHKNDVRKIVNVVGKNGWIKEGPLFTKPWKKISWQQLYIMKWDLVQSTLMKRNDRNESSFKINENAFTHEDISTTFCKGDVHQR